MQIHFMNTSRKCRSEAYLINESYCTCLNGQDLQVLHHLMDTSAESDCIYQHTLTASLTSRSFRGGYIYSQSPSQAAVILSASLTPRPFGDG